ncbi:MAG: M23 family metallopeptidase [Actinomycetes bacterium]
MHLFLRGNRAQQQSALLISSLVASLLGLCFVALSCAPAPGGSSSSRFGSATSTTALGVGAENGTAATLRAITFPVSGGATYVDTFGAPRSGGRTHEGQDLMATKGTPLVAAITGRVTRLRHDLSGLSGNSLTITAADGWSYTYIHLNNDSPGTDDSSNKFEFAFAPTMAVNKSVTAGELVGYLGDSGNAEETVPHLHFEIRQPSGLAINAFASLRAALTAPLIPRTW